MATTNNNEGQKISFLSRATNLLKVDGPRAIHLGIFGFIDTCTSSITYKVQFYYAKPCLVHQANHIRQTR
jgi:hypothetical protein